MRWRYILIILVFLISVDHRICKEALVDGGYFVAITKKSESIPVAFKDSVPLNVAGRGKVNLQIVENGPYTYFMTDMDTLVGEDWTREMYEPIRNVASTDVFGSALIYDQQSITSVFAYADTCDPKTQWIMFVEDTDQMYLGPTIVQKMQLDSDSGYERIVQSREGWVHTYTVYDSTQLGWNMVGQFTVDDKGDFENPDLSLNGFFGVKSSYDGTYMYCEDCTYKKLLDGKIIDCFTSNISFGGLRDLLDDTLIRVQVASSRNLVNENKVHFKYNITWTLTPFHDQTTDAFFHQEIVEFYLIENSDHKFLPDKKLTGFNRYNPFRTDSCYFYPEEYAYKKLYVLKTKGNKRQKTLLASFVYDSTAYFR